jgi:hypothetical protein
VEALSRRISTERARNPRGLARVHAPGEFAIAVVSQSYVGSLIPAATDYPLRRYRLKIKLPLRWKSHTV